MKASTSTATMMGGSSAAPAHNAPLPPSASASARAARIAAHSHITGLGLTTEGEAKGDAAGFVGQQTAREVCKNIGS